MTVRKRWIAILASGGILALILDGQTALAGAVSGVELCLKTVIPSLFPFLFLCSLLTGALWGGHYPWLRPVGNVLGIPEGAESLLIAAVLGGYPAGAQAIGEAYREGRLDRSHAEHLLGFCSNAGPAFLFGMVALQFPETTTAWALWIIQIYGAGIVGILGSSGEACKAVLPPKTTSIPQTLMQTVNAMGMICGWILLFRILADIVTRWLFCFFPVELRVIFTGILELSNGCCCLSRIQSIPLRFLICSGFLSFGGLCVTMQTASVIGNLSLKTYLLGKLFQTGISLTLSVLFLTKGWKCLLFIGIGILIYPVLPQKRGRFSKPYGV